MNNIEKYLTYIAELSSLELLGSPDTKDLAA